MANKKLTRTQKGIISAMHKLRYPATTNDIADKAGMSWITVRRNLKILKWYKLVDYTTKEGREYWFINYEMFE